MPQIYLEIDSSGAVKGIKQYANATDKGADATNKLVNSAGNVNSIFSGIESRLIGVAAAAVSVVKIFGEIKKSLEIAVDFDDKLRVAASYARASETEFLLMGKAAANAGAITSKTAAESAQGLAEFASRGFSVREQIEALIPAIRLAEAAQTDLGRATQVSSGILRGFGKDVSYLERINDIIVGISGASAANLNFLGDAAKYAVPAANAAGESFEVVAAILGTLADKQFEASQSGNAFKNFLISLINPTSKAKKALKELGISTEDAEGNFLGIIPIFEKLGKANIGLKESTRIFGREFSSAALAVSSSIDEVKRDLKLLETGIDGVTNSTAEFQQAGLGGSLRRLSSATEAVYLAIGNKLAPIVLDVADGLAKFAGNASKVAEATGAIVTGIELVTKFLYGLYNAADLAVDGITGLLYIGVEGSPLYNGLSIISDGLKKINVIDVNPFESAKKSLDEFSKAQDGSLERIRSRINSVNDAFSRYRENIESSTKKIKESEEAEARLARAADDAATAAGEQAIAAGSSVEAALEAAKIARETYITSAEASKKQEEADKNAANAAEKRRKALIAQAEEIRKQALLYGATESAANAAADKVLTVAESANKISASSAGNLISGLDQIASKSIIAREELEKIGNVGIESRSGEINYTVGLTTADYDRKVQLLKQSILELNNRYQVIINFDPEGAEELKRKLDDARRELQNTQAIDGYNKKLEELRQKYNEVSETASKGKISITTDAKAADEIKKQINDINSLKQSVDGLIPGLEKVDGVWRQIPTTIATSIEPSRKSIEELQSKSEGVNNIWRRIDGTWTNVLPNGKESIEKINNELKKGAGYADNFGNSVASAAEKSINRLSPVSDELDKVEMKIKNAQDAAGSLKFDKLATSTGAYNAISKEISELELKIRQLDPASNEAQDAIKRLLSLQAQKNEISKSIEQLKDEIYKTGEESEKTGNKAAEAAEKISYIPKSTESAAAAVDNLADANEKLAESASRAIDAAASSTGTYVISVANTIEGINSEIRSLEETIRSLNSIESYGVDTSMLEESVSRLMAKKFQIAMENTIAIFFDNNSIISGATRIKNGQKIAMQQDSEQEDRGGSQQLTINNNFYGMTRSDANDIITESERQIRRA